MASERVDGKDVEVIARNYFITNIRIWRQVAVCGVELHQGTIQRSVFRNNQGRLERRELGCIVVDILDDDVHSGGGYVATDANLE